MAARPDAGSLMQQLEQGQQTRLPKVEAVPQVMPPEMAPQSGLAVTVRHFSFSGNQLLSEERLQQAVAPWLGRPLGFGDLQNAAAAAAAAYRAAGWVVRAYLPAQEIDSGDVKIQIVEATLGEVKISSAPGVRVGADRVRGTALANQAIGQPMNADAVDRALLLISDIPGVGVRGNLAPGGHDAETDIVLDLSPQPLLSGDVALDNTGARSTGSERLALTVFANSPDNFGDQGQLNLVHTQGSDYLRAGWTAPVGYNGLRLGGNLSVMNYQVITSDLGSLGLTGNSQAVGLTLSEPLVRSREKNLYLNAEFDHKYFNNDSNSVSTSDYNVDSFTAGVNGNIAGNDNASTTASLSLTLGNLNLSGSANQAADAAGPNAAGSYGLMRYSVNHVQDLTKNVSLYVALSGQQANKNLDTSEYFYLGGANGVRAYPANEAGGAGGELINVEARYQLPRDFLLTAFYDWGQVTVNQDNGFSGAAALNQYSL